MLAGRNALVRLSRLACLIVLASCKRETIDVIAHPPGASVADREHSDRVPSIAVASACEPWMEWDALLRECKPAVRKCDASDLWWSGACRPAPDVARRVENPTTGERGPAECGPANEWCVRAEWLCAGGPSLVVERSTGKQIETALLARALHDHGQLELLHRCDYGSAEDCYRLADTYLVHPSCAGAVLEDVRAAVSALEKACEGLDLPRACLRLADAHEEGSLGLPRDRRRAAALRMKAATGDGSST